MVEWRPSIRFINIRSLLSFFFFNDTATTEIYTLSLHDALPISIDIECGAGDIGRLVGGEKERGRSEEHTSELQSRLHLVCRLLLEKQKHRSIELGHGHALTATHRLGTGYNGR